MIPNCFLIYFNPIYVYLKKVGEMATENDSQITFRTIALTGLFESLLELFKIQIFGVPNMLLLLVIATVLIDARYGIKKSIKQSELSYTEAKKIDADTPERRMLLKKYELQKFDPKKLQFTFFKCLSLLGYLFFAKNIMETNNDHSSLSEIIGFASGVVLKAPLAIFWYYDFKSIGDNAAYFYGQKAPVFKIVEKIFEPKINNFFENNNNEPKG